MSKKRISQETFDEAVLENINDLDMGRDEAINEAIKQFESQGIDLSFIDTQGENRVDDVLDQIAVLNQATSLESETEIDEEKISSSILFLVTACSLSNKMHKRNSNIFLTRGGLSSLISLLKRDRFS